MLRSEASVLDTAYEVGLSGPSRLHDLFVTHEGMTPGAFKLRGRGLTIEYGFHPCPFGSALVMAAGDALVGLAFADEGGEAASLADMKSRWPEAAYVENSARTAGIAARIFNPDNWRSETPLKVVFIGTDFEIRVWETLLRIPLGRASTYSDIAVHLGKPKAARAVGAAVGRNPVSFVVPCHRVLGKSGGLCGYHWGLTRKRAILGWEAGLAARSP
jgi:AraC family transcriptional regulator of adaptative response/methylated-DNA-[protein]-cysteine methyltransferase